MKINVFNVLALTLLFGWAAGDIGDSQLPDTEGGEETEPVAADEPSTGDAEDDEEYDYEFEDQDEEDHHEENMKIVSDLDLNQDSNITNEEVIAWITKHRNIHEETTFEKALKQYDMDKDGLVTLDEFVKESLSETDFEDDETTKDRFIHQMELRFQIADSDASGSLSKEEFKIVVFPEQYIPDHLVEELLTELDTDNDSKVSFEEYKVATIKLLGDSVSSDMEENILKELSRIIAQFDKDDDGMLDQEEMLPFVTQQASSEEVAESLIKESDQNEDGNLSHEEVLENIRDFKIFQRKKDEL